MHVWSGTHCGRCLRIVNNAKSVVVAINEIILQGEGAGPPDPTVGKSSELAHFYLFEEIVCQHHLEKDLNGKQYMHVSETRFPSAWQVFGQ